MRSLWSRLGPVILSCAFYYGPCWFGGLVCKVTDFTGKFTCYRVRTSCRVQQRRLHQQETIALVEFWACNPI